MDSKVGKPWLQKKKMEAQPHWSPVQDVFVVTKNERMAHSFLSLGTL